MGSPLLQSGFWFTDRALNCGVSSSDQVVHCHVGPVSLSEKVTIKSCSHVETLSVLDVGAGVDVPEQQVNSHALELLVR